MSENKESRIDRLKKILYSRGTSLEREHVIDLHQHEKNVSEKWEEENPAPTADALIDESFYQDDVSKTSFFKKILIGSLVFFVLSAVFAFFVVFKGSNVVSPNNIGVVVIAPPKIPSGEEASFDIEVTNNNDIPIEIVDVIMSYPKGTKSSDRDRSDLPRDRISFGTIEPKETIRRTAKAILYGEEGSLQKIGVDLEYHVPDSNTVFTKEGSYNLAIGTSALSLSLSGVKEITSGQEIKLILTITSNSPEVVKGALLKAEFPFGFSVGSASPLPLEGKTVWNLGDIEPNATRTITIKGKVVGETKDVRYFKFTLGTASKKAPESIDAVIASASQELTVQKPFIGLGISFDRQDDNLFRLKTGDEISVEIDWQNNLSVPVDDVEIEATISGGIVNKKTIKPSMGVEKTNEGKIIWNKFEVDKLERLNPGASGVVDFTFSTFDLDAKEIASLKNQEAVVTVNVKGRRVSEEDVPEEIISSVSKKVKLETNLTLNSSLLHGSGPIENEGLLPPKVNTPTDYTVVWTVSNTFNESENTQVSTTLPSYVEWTGVISPSTEKVVFDPNTKKVTWDLGRVLSGGAKSGVLKQVAFQVRFTPLQSQLGTTPVIVNGATINGVDSFTGHAISDINKELSTVLATDPSFNYGEERVSE